MRFLEGSASPTSTPAKWSASVVALLSRSCLRAKTSCHCPFLYLLRQVKALSRDKHQFSSPGVVLCTSTFQIPIWRKKSSCSFIYSFKCSLVCQNESEDSMVRSFAGRIGVSLMLRYHKTHQWAKVIRPCSSHHSLLVTSEQHLRI